METRLTGKSRRKWKACMWHRGFIGIKFLRALSFAFALACAPAYAIGEEHSAAEVAAALGQSISSSEEQQARQADDHFMQTGDFGGFQGRLVTAPAVVGRVQGTVKRLLVAMGQDQSKWVVRVIEPTPAAINAFVTGGKYIYVFTPLLDMVKNDDTLAVVLGHEIGHSLLHHNTRSQQADSTTVSQWAEIIAVLAKGQKGLERVAPYTKAITASYGRLNESEADAFGATLAYKAGFDPINGVDFFEQMKKQQQEAINNILTQLRTQQSQLMTARATCEQWAQACQTRRTQQTCNQAQQLCNNAENMRLTYNQNVAKVNQNLANQGPSIYDSHPSDQNRIAAVTATVDVLRGVRPIESLTDYVQARNVLIAIRQVKPEMLQAAAATGVNPAPQMGTPSSMADRLRQLDQIKGQGLITEKEYQEKRAEILKGL